MSRKTRASWTFQEGNRLPDGSTLCIKSYDDTLSTLQRSGVCVLQSPRNSMEPWGRRFFKDKQRVQHQSGLRTLSKTKQRLAAHVFRRPEGNRSLKRIPRTHNFHRTDYRKAVRRENDPDGFLIGIE